MWYKESGQNLNFHEILCYLKKVEKNLNLHGIVDNLKKVDKILTEPRDTMLHKESEQNFNFMRYYVHKEGGQDLNLHEILCNLKKVDKTLTLMWHYLS